MTRYQTEIIVAGDRYVWLKLPDEAPLGRASVSIFFQGAPEDQAPSISGARPEGIPELRVPAEPDRDDIEWWEEFEEESGGA